MITRKTKFSLIAGSLATAVILTAGAAFADAHFDGSKEVALPHDQLAYININPAIQMADAYGSLAESGHGTFGKFPANFNAGFHTHSGAYHGIVIKGVMTNPFEGEENPPELEAGSYWYVPANSVHATVCVSDTPCEFYFHADSGFDFFPVE